ncbi:MAG: filamentous hemagglutinin family protein [Burkholderiales bacterium]|jgi:filamentous hemagglutinin family protein
MTRRTARHSPTAPGRLHALALALLAAFGPGALAQSPAAPPMLPGTVAGRTVWSGAAVSAGNGTSDLVIRQSTPRAQLWWDRFDIDRGQTVRFDQQGNRNWVALNWIDDTRPSTIAGRLVADGQVYLINRNGIVFKPGAQVDATSFIASTLSIQDDAFVRGLTALRDGRATFERAANAPTTARIEVQSGPVTNLAGQPVLGPNGQQLVEAARITSADGGRVFLFATSEVINNGLISSPSGQIVLAAGQKVYLFAPTNQDSAAFRGLFIEVGSGGEARNLGTLVSDRGNTTLVGLAVNNEGRISARSALSGNGSVWLIARSDLPESFDVAGRPTALRSGTATLGPRSRIELQPVSELDASGRPLTAIDSQQVFPSQVRIEGGRIVLQGDAQGGASIVAPGGQVQIVASDTPLDPEAASGVRPVGAARVYVGPNVEISVAGVRDVQVSVERNLLDVELRGENLGDGVALRSPSLAGTTLRVDQRIGSPLFSQDTLNRLAAQQVGRTVEERSGTGGSIRIQSDGDAIVEPGARFDVAGGSLRYLPGVLATSTLFDGQRTLDVSQAPADRLYQRADSYSVTDARWGVTRSWSFAYRGRRDPGYVEGLSAGSLQLDAPFLTMNGLLEGSVVVGGRQAAAPPAGGLLTFGNQRAFQQANPDFRLQAPVRFETAPAATPVGEAADRVAVFGDPASPDPLRVDAAALAARGVSRIEVFTNEGVTVPAGSRVELPAGGRLTVASGGGMTVAGDIIVPGAREQVVTTVSGRDSVSRGIDLSGVFVQGASVETATRPVDVTVTGARVSAAGQWRVDAVEPAPDAPTSAAVVNGGSVRLSSPTSVSVDAASTVDVSAGARMSPTRALAVGTAGRIELLSTDTGGPDRAAVGRISTAGTLTGYGFATGGALRIDAADIVVGAPAPAGALSVLPDFFLTGGFADYDLRAQSTLTLAAGVSIRPSQRNRRFDPDGTTVADGDALRAVSPIVQRPDTERRPVSVAFRAPSPYRGVLVQGQGGEIAVERGGRITLEAGLRMDVQGRLDAPGGTIVASVGRAPGSGSEFRGFRGEQGLYVGRDARVSADGVDATWRDDAGRISGSVLAGGTITFDAWDGYLVLDAGSRFSARGASGTLLARSIDSPDAAPTERTVPSEGGRVRFSATNGGALAPRVDVAAGGAGAAHGTLELRVPDLQGGTTGEFGPVPSGLQTTAVVADAAAVPQGFVSGADLDRLRNGPSATTTEAASGRPTLLTVAASAVDPAAPRDRLVIEARDRIALEGGTTIGAVRELRLDAPVLAVTPGVGGTAATVRAPYVALGNGRVANLREGAASGGAGSLGVDAPVALDLVGTLALQGVSRSTLATDGDLRLVGLFRDQIDRVAPYAEGALSAYGSVELIARRLFPTTLSRYAITVLGDDGAIRSTPRGDDALAPLSAGGSLSMRAATIDLAGRAFAPQGRIDLDAAGALSLRDGARVSVVGGDLPVPLGDTQDQRRLSYAFTAASTRDLTSLPRSVTIAGESIRIAPGAVVDASGGGEVLASSFVASSRGASDLLQRPNVYAVIPGLDGATPYDFVAQREMLASRGSALTAFRGAMPSSTGVGIAPAVSVGDRVYLTASDALPAGFYTLLPARYATLPGAVVIAATTARDAAPARNTTLSDGSSLVAGYRAAEAVGPRDTRWASFNVLPAATVAQYGEYVTDTGTRFFAAEAARTEAVVPRLPADAGTLTLTARGPVLDLAGTLALRGATATGTRAAGRSGEVEIAASRIAVLESGPAPDGFVGVTAERISTLQAERVVIGGRSAVTTDPDAVDGVGALRTVTAIAAEVRLQAGASLSGQDVSLVATDRIEVGRGAQIAAAGGPSFAERLDTGTAAYLGASSNTRQTLSVPTASTARVELGAGVRVQAARASIAAPGGASIDPAVDLRVGGISAAAERVVLGGTEAVATGSIVLTDGLLAALGSADSIALSASREIALAGGARVGTDALGTLVLRAPVLVRTGAQAPVRIVAGAFDWRWNGPDATPGALVPAATLSVSVQGRADDPARDGRVTLGEGVRRIEGFEQTTISASTALGVVGSGATTVDGSLAITAPVIAAQVGSTQRIQAGGELVTRGGGAAAAAAGPGGRLVLEASRIDHGGAIQAPSGDVQLVATGPDAPAGAAIVLRPGSRIDASGETVETRGVRYGTSGGSVSLISAAGSIDAQAGSAIAVTAGPGDAAGGRVRVEAPTGRVALSGTLEGRASGADRSSLSVNGAVVVDPSAILREAQRGGFDGSVSVRARSGDLAIAGTPGATLLGAREISLSADAGDVSLTGVRLDASGAAGGRIAIDAGGAVRLDGASALAALGSAGRGGEVALSGAAGVGAALGARVDVGGVTGGVVDVRVPAERLDDVAIPAGTIVGASQTRLTFVQRYDGIDSVTRNAAGSGILALTDAFAAAAAFASPANVARAAQRLGVGDTSLLRLRPEIEVRSAVGGDIAVQQPLDFSTTRFTSSTAADTAGVLTLAADRNLLLTGGSSGAVLATAVLNDGFGGVTGGPNTAAEAAFMGTAPATWSFRLVAGADRAAADPLRTRAAGDPILGGTDGRIALGAGRSIRTGTGSITLSAARDILLGVDSADALAPLDSGVASIFTAGRSAPALDGFRNPTIAGTQIRPAYTQDGGDITLRAGGSILAAESDRIVSSWLFRSGQVAPDGTVANATSAVSWWPEFRYFTQNVGALGGGTVRIEAGADVRNLSAAIGSSGRLPGTNTFVADPVVTGGGRLDVRAGGSIGSGTYTVMLGSGRIVAGDTVALTRELEGAPVPTLVALGDAAVSIEARRELTFGRAYNPTLAPQRTENARTASRRSHFSTYGESSELSLVSLSGSVDLRSVDPTALAEAAGSPTESYDNRDTPITLWPARLLVRAPDGDVQLRNHPNSILLSPSPQGQLDVVAGRSITGSGTVIQSDADPILAFGVRQPFALVDERRFREFSSDAHAQLPVHRDDNEPSRLVAGRDVATSPNAASQLRIVTAEALQVDAGRDVRNLVLSAQNVRASDVTRVVAGRDVVNDSQVNARGQLQLGSDIGIVVTGPGRLDVRAARDIAMGTSRGIVTRGNLDNVALPERGASIVLVAGLPEDPAYDAFLAAYAGPQANGGPRLYQQEMIAFVAAETGASGLDLGASWSRLQALPADRRSELARSLFFLELRTAGRAASDPSNPTFRDFQAAYDAMGVMFPKDGRGNVDLVFSQVKTERGGDIRMMVPGAVCRGAAADCASTDASRAVGNVSVGLTSPPAELAQGKPASQLGIFTLQGGDIQAAVGNDIAVNRSRILTVAGGGITLFSATGDIDAGRGSKSATSAPPPLVRVDEAGNIVVELPGVVEGSGIGVLVTQPGVTPGDIDLFAPKGIIDAGEAGIRAAGNITVFASQVLNASNISVGGSSTGVPTVTATPSLSLASSASSSTGSARSATDAAERAASDATKSPRSTQRILVLEFLGFGDEGEETWQRRRAARAR